MPARAGARSGILVARDIVGSKVVDADGEGLGRVVDLDIDVAGGFAVTALEIGHPQVIARLQLLRPLSQARTGHRPRTVAWTDVERIDDGRIILKRGARVRDSTTSGEGRSADADAEEGPDAE